jgi:ABC-2 type transport system ATP-binding protein
MENNLVAECRGVSKRFGKLSALDNVDLAMRRGELLALLGPNGAGKTTAVSLLLGLLSPDTGTVQVLGEPPHSMAAKRHIGVMMQEAGLVAELRVREHIDLVSSYYANPYPPADLLEMLRLSPIANRPYGKLSGGQKRQVQFALAICGRPSVLFLDEPTVGLDLESRESLWSIVRHLVDQGAAVLLTTHYLEEAEALADRVAVLANGRRIACGTVGEVRSLVVRTRITCVTSLRAEEVAAWPGVTSAERQRHKLELTTANPESVVRRLLAADCDLQDLEVRRAGLSDAFTELIQEAA